MKAKKRVGLGVRQRIHDRELFSIFQSGGVKSWRGLFSPTLDFVAHTAALGSFCGWRPSAPRRMLFLAVALRSMTHSVSRSNRKLHGGARQPDEPCLSASTVINNGPLTEKKLKTEALSHYT